MKQKKTEPSYDQEIFVKQNLRKQLSLFRRGWLSESGWKHLLHDKDELNLFPPQSVWDIRNKCKYIAIAIETALDSYDQHGWTICCEMAIKKIIDFEKTEHVEFIEDDTYNKRWNITSPKTLMKWYSLFNHQNSECFINQYNNCSTKTLPPFLENNSDVKDVIVAYCNNNLLNLTTLEVQEYVITKCLPELVEKRKVELCDDSITIEHIKKENNLKTICKQTITQWLNILGFRFCEKKKSYYTVTVMKSLRMWHIDTNSLIDIWKEKLDVIVGYNLMRHSIKNFLIKITLVRFIKEIFRNWLPNYLRLKLVKLQKS